MADFSASCPATFNIDCHDDSVCIRLGGEWSVSSLESVAESFVSALKKLPKSGEITLSLDEVERLDTAGAMIINKALGGLEDKDANLTVKNDNERYKLLLDTARPVSEDEKPDPPAPLPIRLVCQLGKQVVEGAQTGAGILSFLGQFLVVLFRQILAPHKVRWTSLFFFMDQTGLRSLPIVLLLLFLIGMVIAYMGMTALAIFNAENLTTKLLEVSVLRELGVLITAIVVAGRSSSSFTAQIGSMVANEEVAAIRSMGLDPMILLVIPRVVGLILTFPLVVFLANVVAILGGGLAICLGTDITLQGFVLQFSEASQLKNFNVGMIKTPFFALIIGLVGCYHGFQAKTSAESVGFLTTKSVVLSIFLVILVDAVFAIFFATIKY